MAILATAGRPVVRQNQAVDTNEAVKQLRDFEDTLSTVREHRGLIVKMIEQIDAGLACQQKTGSKAGLLYH